MKKIFISKYFIGSRGSIITRYCKWGLETNQLPIKMNKVDLFFHIKTSFYNYISERQTSLNIKHKHRYNNNKLQNKKLYLVIFQVLK